ncbi:MAG: hypothetical protein WCK62_06730 [Actinomycetes bacterium]
MAELIREGNDLVLVLSKKEQVFALNRTQRAPISKFKSVSAHEDLWARGILKGLRMPGTGLPYKVLYGTMRYPGGKDFTAIYGRGPGFVMTFDGLPFKRWIFTSDLSESGMNLILENS